MVETSFEQKIENKKNKNNNGENIYNWKYCETSVKQQNFYYQLPKKERKTTLF